MKTVVVAVVSAVVALAVGVGIGYAVWAGGTTSGEAADRAELACQGAEGLPDTFDGAGGIEESYAALGTGALAQSAGEADPAYAEVGEAGEMVARTLQLFDEDGYPGAVEDLLAACEAR